MKGIIGAVLIGFGNGVSASYPANGSGFLWIVGHMLVWQAFILGTILQWEWIKEGCNWTKRKP